MKKQILKATKVALLLIVSLCLAMNFSCSSEDGRDGIDGQQGEQGPQGPAGQDGNADVTQYNYAAFTHDGNGDPRLFDIPVPWAEFQESLVLCYAQDDNYWYAIPGIVYGSLPKNYYRSTFAPLNGGAQSRMQLRMESTLSEGGAKDFNGLRIIVAPASTIEDLSSKGTVPAINFNDYEAVKAHYGLTN